MRRLMLFCSLVLIAVEVQAGPKRVLTAVPRAFGRTAENMVTLKDRRLALNQWILMGAVLVDAKTSLDLTRRCPEPCENYSFVWGAHPPAARVYGLLGLTGFYYSTIDQVSWEISYTETDPTAHLFERYFFLFPAVLHGWFAFRNAQIQPASSPAPQGKNNLPPELRTDHAIPQ
jgi:hypothetical protein